jgi:predicted RNA-binding Zn-ribbon protein involved in translation (DUF1610 family)
MDDRDAKTGKALFECPTTGKTVETGMVITRAELESMGSRLGDTFACIACGEHHLIVRDSFIFQEEG